MSKRNQKKNQRKKANIKKRNLQRVARKSSPESQEADHGLSLANAGAKDLMEILTWSRVLAEEPEFEDSIFDPLECTNAFNKHSVALGLDKNAEELPKEVYWEKQTELTLATVESVITKSHQKQIYQRLKKMKTRVQQTNNDQLTSRIDILLSLINFSKDEKVWGTVGLVSALVMKNVRDLMLFTSIAQSVEVEGNTFEDLMTSIKAHPEHARMVAMVERNPKLVNYFQQRFDKIWADGFASLENGSLGLNLFSLETYQYAEKILEEIRTAEGDYDADKGPEFLSQLRDYFAEQLNDEAWFGSIQARFAEIVTDESIDPNDLVFAFRLRNAFEQADWVNEHGPDVMVQILIADLQHHEEMTMESEDEISSEDTSV